MQTPVSIAFRHIESSPALETRIQEEVAKLEHLFGRITSCHVVIEAPGHRPQQGGLFQVSVDLHGPGKEIAVTGPRRKDHAHEDVHVALRDAFEAVAPRLEDHARRARGDVKTHRPSKAER